MHISICIDFFHSSVRSSTFGSTVRILLKLENTFPKSTNFAHARKCSFIHFILSSVLMGPHGKFPFTISGSVAVWGEDSFLLGTIIVLIKQALSDKWTPVFLQLSWKQNIKKMRQPMRFLFRILMNTILSLWPTYDLINLKRLPLNFVSWSLGLREANLTQYFCLKAYLAISSA